MREVVSLLHARGVLAEFFLPPAALYITIITPFMFYPFGYIATLSLIRWGPLLRVCLVTTFSSQWRMSIIVRKKQLEMKKQAGSCCKSVVSYYFYQTHMASFGWWQSDQGQTLVCSCQTPFEINNQLHWTSLKEQDANTNTSESHHIRNWLVRIGCQTFGPC